MNRKLNKICKVIILCIFIIYFILRTLLFKFNNTLKIDGYIKLSCYSLMIFMFFLGYINDFWLKRNHYEISKDNDIKKWIILVRVLLVIFFILQFLVHPLLYIVCDNIQIFVSFNILNYLIPFIILVVIMLEVLVLEDNKIVTMNIALMGTLVLSYLIQIELKSLGLNNIIEWIIVIFKKII